MILQVASPSFRTKYIIKFSHLYLQFHLGQGSHWTITKFRGSSSHPPSSIADARLRLPNFSQTQQVLQLPVIIFIISTLTSTVLQNLQQHTAGKKIMSYNSTLDGRSILWVTSSKWLYPPPNSLEWRQHYSSWVVTSGHIVKIITSEVEASCLSHSLPRSCSGSSIFLINQLVGISLLFSLWMCSSSIRALDSHINFFITFPGYCLT